MLSNDGEKFKTRENNSIFGSILCCDSDFIRRTRSKFFLDGFSLWVLFGQSIFKQLKLKIVFLPYYSFGFSGVHRHRLYRSFCKSNFASFFSENNWNLTTTFTQICQYIAVSPCFFFALKGKIGLFGFNVHLLNYRHVNSLSCTNHYIDFGVHHCRTWLDDMGRLEFDRDQHRFAMHHEPESFRLFLIKMYFPFVFSNQLAYHIVCVWTLQRTESIGRHFGEASTIEAKKSREKNSLSKKRQPISWHSNGPISLLRNFEKSSIYIQIHNGTQLELKNYYL